MSGEKLARVSVVGPYLPEGSTDPALTIGLDFGRECYAQGLKGGGST